MAIRSVEVQVVTAGGAGVATGSKQFSLPPCSLKAIHLDFNASAPATTDLTITNRGRNIFARADSAADAVVHPRVGAVDPANAAITGSWAEMILSGVVDVVLAQANALDPALTAVFFYEV